MRRRRTGKEYGLFSQSPAGLEEERGGGRQTLLQFRAEFLRVERDGLEEPAYLKDAVVASQQFAVELGELFPLRVIPEVRTTVNVEVFRARRERRRDRRSGTLSGRRGGGSGRRSLRDERGPVMRFGLGGALDGLTRSGSGLRVGRVGDGERDLRNRIGGRRGRDESALAAYSACRVLLYCLAGEQSPRARSGDRTRVFV